MDYEVQRVGLHIGGAITRNNIYLISHLLERNKTNLRAPNYRKADHSAIYNHGQSGELGLPRNEPS